MRGIFPLNYVEVSAHPLHPRHHTLTQCPFSVLCDVMQVLTSLEEAYARAEEREGEARARYTFNAQTDLELSLKKVCNDSYKHINKNIVTSHSFSWTFAWF